jgi:DNA-binding CsgD family transcriptional regulator
VTSLLSRDAERLLRFVAEAGRSGSDRLFTRELLTELGRLVSADSVAYNELDRVRRRNLFYVERSPDDEPDPEIDMEIFWDLVIEEHPVCLAHQRGRFGALKLSDFGTPRALRRMRVYEIWLRPYGVVHELSVALPSPLWHTKTLMFTRHGGEDFTERDRLILDRLQPHLVTLWQAANGRRLVRAALAELDRTDESEQRGVVLLGTTQDVEFASPPARRLLRTYFRADNGGRLPPEIRAWLESGSRTFGRRRGGRELKIERSVDSLLLQERRVQPELTPREREILAWVARGKTNPEIAELLWVAPGTVRKHLENVYTKLGVNTRTAAVARFLGVLDAESA